MEETPVTKSVVMEEKAPKDFKKHESLEDIDEVELPPEKIGWPFTLVLLYFHCGSLYFLKLLLEGRVGWATVVTGFIFGYAGGFGVTIGAHRLWSHRSFKAKTALRYVLAICQSTAVQGSLLQWVTWHRVHHRFSDTKLDPHNASRGLFYSHIGWLLTYDPRRYKIQQRYAHVEDLEADPVVMWQDKYNDLILLVLGLITPTLIPWLLFNNELEAAWYGAVCVRITVSLNFTFTVNSLAHLYGNQPYDNGIYPCENKLVTLLALGEGWHNYHHTFPWDYRTSEFGGSAGQTNWSASIIDFLAKMGWAYDLKFATPAVVEARMKRTGGSRATVAIEENQMPVKAA